MLFVRKSSKYTMKKDAASETLQNILEACDKPAINKYDEEIKKSTPVASGYILRIIIATAILVITLVMPLMFAPSLFSEKYNARRSDVTIGSYEVNDSTLYINLDGSFINNSSIYAIRSDGEMVYPRSINIWDDSFYFDYDDTEWNIYVNDTNGNTVHMLLTPPQ